MSEAGKVRAPDRTSGGVCGALALAAFAVLLSCKPAAPLAHDFEQERELDDIGWNCRTQFRLSGEHSTSGTRSLEVEFFPDPSATSAQYPGFSFGRFDPDWSGTKALVLDVYNPADQPLSLGVRIDDRKEPPYADRFNASLPLAPGQSRLVVPLSGLVTSGTRRALDPSRITGVTLFVANPSVRRILYFDRLRLE